MERVTSRILMKRNLKALLRHRGKGQGELARHLRRTGGNDKAADSWISHILDERSDRELPMEHWDRAADFLGVDTYHFFLPGVASNDETERRSGTDRRQRADRRIGQDLPARTRDLDLMNIIRALPTEAVEEAIGELMKILDKALRRRRATPASPAASSHTTETTEATHVHGRAKRKNG